MLKTTRNFALFDTQWKLGEMWARSLYQMMKLYLRPNLLNTFYGRPLRDCWARWIDKIKTEKKVHSWVKLTSGCLITFNAVSGMKRCYRWLTMIVACVKNRALIYGHITQTWSRRVLSHCIYITGRSTNTCIATHVIISQWNMIIDDTRLLNAHHSLSCYMACRELVLYLNINNNRVLSLYYSLELFWELKLPVLE